MKLWIDCEFNEFQGELISLALVDENGQEWYEVLHCEKPGTWVAEHVMPILGKRPIDKIQFQNLLQWFLGQYRTVHIIADWPEDIAHFCQALITGPGMRLNTPPLTMEVVRIDAASETPHNALADARGIRYAMLGTTKEDEIQRQRLDILKHTLGMESRSPGFRNYFITGELGSDGQQCEELVRLGYMDKRPYAGSSTHETLYFATDTGKALVDLADAKGSEV